MAPFQPVRFGGLITGANAQLTFGFVTATSGIRHELDSAKDAPVNTLAWFTSEVDAEKAFAVPQQPVPEQRKS